MGASPWGAGSQRRGFLVAGRVAGRLIVVKIPTIPKVRVSTTSLAFLLAAALALTLGSFAPAASAGGKPGVAICGAYYGLDWMPQSKTSVVKPSAFYYGCWPEFGLAAPMKVKWKKYTKKKAVAKARIKWGKYPDGNVQTYKARLKLWRPKHNAVAQPAKLVFTRMKVTSDETPKRAKLTGKFKINRVKSTHCRLGYSPVSSNCCPIRP